jgi:ATP-dependent exoDNAse (exonuclease V) alpha subunit
VEVNTKEFSHLSLGYALHVYKGQGITTEASGILTGGWQTDKEHAYVALSRAREQTQVYVAREDLGEQGMDAGAIERLGERMRQSRAQEASIAREVDEKAAEHQARIECEIARDRDIDRGFGIE